MKKIFFFAAIAAAALSSCSSEELVQAEQPVVEDGAILFSAYQGRDTRVASTPFDAADYDKAGAGDDQNITIAKLKGDGFGVFAYEQGDQELVSYLAGNTYPNFMYNQPVYACSGSGDGHALTKSATGGHFDYSPLKYWPNNKDAKVTFQAYAPYNPDVEVAFGPAYNGVGVRYNTSEGKDILWGANNVKVDGDDKKSTCYYDETKPTTAAKTTFYFKHALTKLDFTVSYFTDNEHDGGAPGVADGTIALDANTKIVVRNIRLVGSLPSQGVLSLYDGKWTIERTAENTGLNTADLTKLASDDSPLADNGTLTKTVKAIKADKSMMVIPTATPAPVHVEITYDVITTDPNNASNNSIVTNTVSSKDNADNLYTDGHGFAGISLEAGKWTTVNIHLGLTSAKFDAHVVNWDEATKQNVDLPNNDTPTPPTTSNRR